MESIYIVLHGPFAALGLSRLNVRPRQQSGRWFICAVASKADVQILPGTGRCPEGAEGSLSAAHKLWGKPTTSPDPSVTLRAPPPRSGEDFRFREHCGRCGLRREHLITAEHSA
jgi:hypothetical protein